LQLQRRCNILAVPITDLPYIFSSFSLKFACFDINHCNVASPWSKITLPTVTEEDDNLSFGGILFFALIEQGTLKLKIPKNRILRSE